MSDRPHLPPRDRPRIPGRLPGAPPRPRTERPRSANPGTERPRRPNPFDAYEGADADQGIQPADARRDAAPDKDTDRPGTGWDKRAVRYHPDRPDVDAIHLTDDRRVHIFDGDAKGGGHRHGTGNPRRTEFPAEWDDDTAAGWITDIAKNPDGTPEWQHSHRWRITGSRNGVTVLAVVLPDARIWTAYPLPGGRGVTENLRRQP